MMVIMDIDNMVGVVWKDMEFGGAVNMVVHPMVV